MALCALCFHTVARLRLSLIDIFSQEVFFDPVSTEDFDNFKTCEIATVTLFIIFTVKFSLIGCKRIEAGLSSCLPP